MKVINPIPQAKIAEYVDRILVIEHYEVADQFTLPLFANGVPSLLYRSTKSTIGNSSANNLTLFGQTVFPEKLTIPGNFTMIAYFFKPFALLSLFGITAQELTDNPIDLTLLSAQKTNELQERLLNADTATDMMKLLDNYIASLVAKTKTNCELIKYATGILTTNTAKDTLIKIQKELHVTERTFQRMFEKNIGISPNLYRRVCQFNAAFEQLNHRKFEKLSDIAFDNSYADQSHYIRAFKEFTNITPKDYLNYGTSEE